MQKITLQEVKFAAFRLAKERMAFNEPIPDFSTRYPGKLESCLSQPFLNFNQKDLYPGLISKASILFYLMVKNHPFFNGNKRIALTTLLIFLYKNKFWINIQDKKMYEFAIKVTKSKPEEKDQTLKNIQNFIRTNIEDIPNIFQSPKDN